MSHESVRSVAVFQADAFYASVPSRAGNFKPLPKRKSPKPWDLVAVEAHFSKMPKSISGITETSARSDKFPRSLWGLVLPKMQMGESMVSRAAIISITNATGKYRRLLGFRFTVEQANGGGWKVTRIG